MTKTQAKTEAKGRPRGRVVEDGDGFYAVLQREWHGPWRSHAEARGGLEVERRRLQVREQREAAAAAARA